MLHSDVYVFAKLCPTMIEAAFHAVVGECRRRWPNLGYAAFNKADLLLSFYESRRSLKIDERVVF